MTIGIGKEKDLLAGIAADGYGDGYIVDVSLAKSYAIQLVVSAPSSPSGCTVTLSSSLDRLNWVALTPVAVTVATTVYLTPPTGYVKYIKVAKALSSGSVVIKALLVETVELP